MWYVLQVASGREDSMLSDISRVLKRFDGVELFIPRYIRLRRYQGEWHRECAVLFSGYIFMDAGAEQVKEIQKTLYILGSAVKPVCIGGGFYPIRAEEQQFLESVMDGMHEVGLSVGEIVDGKLVVERGPLRNKTQYVRRIDRHKRTAEVGVKIFGEERLVRMGLEVRAKSMAI